jgi:FtsP/CotA-like multicopper oxidase with cupredoxin domain
MSRNQRIGLIVAAVVVAVVAFVIASSGGDDNTDTATKTTGTTTSTKTGTDTSPTPTQPLATMIRISGNKVAGGSTEVHAKNGDAVEIVVSADAPTVLHLHGYEIEKTAKPGQPARFRFKANLEGQFDLESHTAEDAGLDPLVAKVIVEPK